MRRVVVHAHCYQPPREEPWLDLVPEEPSALPDHDWNARITRECYRPLSRARVLDGDGRTVRVHNAWAWLSFNVGPTLVHWLERHATDVLDAMREGDRAAIARTGYGTAIAHPYHHVILPLASRRDKRTEVRWGIREFRRLFERDPFAMWLPETAVDDDTLEVLAEEGIRGTILAPRQVTTTDPTGAPLAWDRPDLDMRILAYDGALAHDVAFGPLLEDANRFAARLTQSADAGVTALATDGETFGHHHRFGDLAIAGMIDALATHPTARLVGAEAVLQAAAVPTVRTNIVAPSAWSCVHGVDRWQADCGCRMDPHTSQAWRAPLRAGLEVLSLGLDAVVEREWPHNAGNRHAIRDIAGPRLDGAGPLPPPAKLLLEAERHALAMFTSCAWFFDDLARIEPRVVLRHAARALEFLPAADAAALETAFRTALAEAHANEHTDGTGITIWDRDILPGRRAVPALVAGIAALHDLAPHAPFDGAMPAHDWTLDGATIVTLHRTSGRTRRWHAEPITLGVVPRRIHVRERGGGGWSGVILLEEIPAPLRRRLLSLALPVVLEAAVGSRHQGAAAMLGGLAALLPRILDGAWQRASAGDPGQSATIVHAVLDLWSLSGVPLPDATTSDAWLRLALWPACPERDQLAERFGIAFRDS